MALVQHCRSPRTSLRQYRGPVPLSLLLCTSSHHCRTLCSRPEERGEERREREGKERRRGKEKRGGEGRKGEEEREGERGKEREGRRGREREGERGKGGEKKRER